MSATATSLPIDVVARCTQQARQDGVFAGLSSGLVGALIGSKLFRLNRNATILCATVTGILSGYQYTQAFLAGNLARAEAEAQKRAAAEPS